MKSEIGINIKGDITDVMIKRNTTIPVKKTVVYETSWDNQTTVNFIATEGMQTPLSAFKKG